MERKFEINYPFKSNDDLMQSLAKLEDNPTPELILEVAEALAAHKKYSEANILFSKLLDLIPFDPLIMYKAGISCFEDKELLRAKEYFKKLINHHPDNYNYLVIMGMIYNSLGLTFRANCCWWAAHQVNRSDYILRIMSEYFTDEMHPERLAVYPICEQGRGIEIGCGYRKSHPKVIGVDIVGKGSQGMYGNVKGKISQADIECSGDSLPMFNDDELDYIVLRHNLEHYKDPIKALFEWKRLLKPGGILAMVVPDDENCDTIHLDPTHYHVFTMSSLERILTLIGGFKNIYSRKLLKNWSFISIYQKMPISIEFDYYKLFQGFEINQLQLKSEELYHLDSHIFAQIKDLQNKFIKYEYYKENLPSFTTSVV